MHDQALGANIQTHIRAWTIRLFKTIMPPAHAPDASCANVSEHAEFVCKAAQCCPSSSAAPSWEEPTTKELVPRQTTSPRPHEDPHSCASRPFRRASPSQTWLDEGSPSARQRARSPRCAQPAMRHKNASDPASRGRRRTQWCLGRQVPRATRSRRVASAHGAFRTGVARVCVGTPKN